MGHFVWLLAPVKHHLGAESSSTKAIFVLPHLMSKLRQQDLVLLETLVNSLVTGESLVHSTGVSPGDVMMWGSDLVVAAVAFVTNDHFISSKTVLQTNPEDVNVGPSAAHKWSIDPHN